MPRQMTAPTLFHRKSSLTLWTFAVLDLILLELFLSFKVYIFPITRGTMRSLVGMLEKQSQDEI